MTTDINNCQKCDLCKSRSHFSKNSGRKPANVLFVFDKEYSNDEVVNRQNLFIKRLNELLEWDWFRTTAIRCFPAKEIDYEHIEACRKYLGRIIVKINPHLIVLFGKTPVKMVFGEKYKNIPRNIFYSKLNNNGKKRIYFLVPKITAPISALEKSYTKLYNYIQENYK
jgi:uracil-DNA glycosylase family 4